MIKTNHLGVICFVNESGAFPCSLPTLKYVKDEKTEKPCCCHSPPLMRHPHPRHGHGYVERLKATAACGKHRSLRKVKGFE
jgi:hypothetical protein